jgi:hypothetical protein
MTTVPASFKDVSTTVLSEDRVDYVECNVLVAFRSGFSSNVTTLDSSIWWSTEHGCLGLLWKSKLMIDSISEY